MRTAAATHEHRELAPIDDDDDDNLVPLGLAVEALGEATAKIKEDLVARYYDDVALELFTPGHISSVERELISACMVRPETIDELPVNLSADDFSARPLGLMWKAIKDLHARGSRVASIDVVEELLRRALLDDVGGELAIRNVEASCGHPAAAPFHARRIRENAQCLQFQRVLLTFATRAKARDGEVSKLAHECISAIERATSGSSTSTTVHMPTVMANVLKTLPGLGYERPVVRSGFKALDEKLGGGISRGELMIVAARPSMGKTALCLDFVRNVAIERGEHVAIFSLEMPRNMIGERLLAASSGVNTKIARMSSEQQRRLYEAAGVIGNAPIHLDDTPVLAIGEIRARARQLKRRHDLQLIVVDYLQLADGDDLDAKRIEQITVISKGLKGLARELDLPVIALSQLSRAVESRQDKRPMMSDLRESGAIEQDADVIAFLYRDEYYMKEKTPASERGRVELDIAKNRNGQTGKVLLHFANEVARFEDVQS